MSFPLSKSLWMKWKVSIKKKKQHKSKPVEAAGGGGEGDERAIVVNESSSSPLQLQMEEPSWMVMMDASLFDCAFCSAALKPPTFKVVGATASASTTVLDEQQDSTAETREGRPVRAKARSQRVFGPEWVNE